MRSFGRYAPWFRASDGDYNEEPFSYRAWKWAAQQRFRTHRSSDLFDRIRGVDWDLLVILDACRYDTLDDVVDEAVIEPAVSPATATGPFLDRAREAGVFDGTTFVSANPQSGEHSPGAVAEHVPVYETHWNDDLQTVLPSDVYEAAKAQVEDGRRVVAHTIQPHYPHICRLGDEIRPVPNGLHPMMLDTSTDEALKVQSVLARGAVDLSRAEKSYRCAVRFAWEAARDFATSLSKDGYTVAITADHGELFGEWGFVEHPVDVRVRALRTVPWTVFEPVEKQGGSVSDRLEALGYVD